MRRVPWPAIGLLLLSSLGMLAARDRLVALEPATSRADRLLYLPNGKHLKLLSMGHASLLADWLYIWAIQYYSDYEREDRYRYVEHVFGDVIAELDPHYVDPYWLGALIMTVEAKNLEAGLKLLDKGFARNPEQWVLPYLAGWECYRAGDYDRAGQYFRKAAAVPGAPPGIGRLQAGSAARAGDLRRSFELWREVSEDPNADEATRAVARRQLRATKIRIDLQQLEGAIGRFAERVGRRPARLDDLVRAGLLRELPLDPDGEPYAYDPRTGEVSTRAGRVLGRSG